MKIIVPQGEKRSMTLDFSELGTTITPQDIEKYIVVLFSVTNNNRFEYAVTSIQGENNKGRVSIPSGLKKVTGGYALDTNNKNGTAYIPVGMYNVEIGFKGTDDEVSVVSGLKDFLEIVPSNFMYGLIPQN